MTMTNGARDMSRDMPRDIDLTPADARALAREAWLLAPETTGAELGERYGMSAEWGRKQIRAARTERDAAQPAAVTARAAAHPNGTAGGTGPRTAAPAKRDAPPSPSRTAARPRPAHTVPAGGAGWPLVAVTVAAVVVVTAVTGVVSYSHIRDLADHAGMGSMSGWLPLGVDGLVVACSCSIIVDRRQDRAGHPLAWAGLLLGLAGSLAANVLAVDPDLVSLRVVRWVLAGYGPLALAVSGHLLFRMLGDG